MNNHDDISLPNRRSRPATAQPSGAAAGRSRRHIGRGDSGSLAPAARTRQPDDKQANAGKVAIVGFAGRFPGADNTAEFWRLLVNEQCAISELPYWDLPGIAERRHLREEFACPGGFISHPAAFDADFFQISAREAEAMDPQHRVVLEQTWAAFEDAGIRPETLRGSDTAVYIGVSSADYNGLLARSAAGAHDATGNAHSIIANRISFLFDFHGPSAPVDTACSSSLVAVHRAAQSILAGDSKVAVAGGVNLCFEPMVFIGAAKAGMLSPGGRCKTFAADADGYVRGEGVAVLILKDYQQALADGDNIVATIIGSAENHGGHANSLTAPNARAQADLIKHACRNIDVGTIRYIETHGTGTKLGDPIEIRGLKQAFAELGGAGQHRCYLGSVKTNIGHLESAAGIAGVIKVLLMMKQGYLPRSLHSEQLNPYIDLADSPFEVLQQGRPWPQAVNSHGEVLPRRAGVSSFGFGGSNAHVVLEASEPASAGAPGGIAGSLFPLSAKTPGALRGRVEQLADFIEQQPALSLTDLAATLQMGREAMEYRLAIAAHDRVSLLAQLRAHLAAGDSGHAATGRAGGQGREDEVAQALKQQDSQRLLALWRQGETIDWRQLYPSGRIRRIPLPTYPFCREIYWISESRSADVADHGVLHPLVQRNTSDLAGQRFSSSFNGNEFFFDQHRVNGLKTLPGVAYLEMARAAITLSLGDDRSLKQLKNIAWQQPMTHTGGELAIDIELAEQNNGDIHFEIAGAGPDGLVYCRGAGLTGAGETIASLDLPAIAANTGQKVLDPQQCYRIFEKMGLEYGRLFRGIRALQTGRDQVLAELALPGEAAGPTQGEPLRLHPGLLDSALQAALGLALLNPAQPEQQTQPLVPFALDGLIIGDLTVLGDSCRAWLRYAADHRPGRINKLDIDLCDAEGRVALRLLGFSSRRLDNARAAMPAEQLVMAPLWRDQGPRSDTADTVYRHQLVLLAGDGQIAADRLASCCRALAEHGPAFRIQSLTAGGNGTAEKLEALAGELLMQLRACEPDCLVQLVIIGGEPEQEELVFAPLRALLKTAKSEGLIAAGQLIKAGPINSPEQLAKLLVDDSRQSEDEQIRYLSGQGGFSARPQRQVASWQGIALGEAAAGPWRAGGVYLLTGGTGELGLLVAESIAREAAGVRLILCSRSAGRLSVAKAAKIADIESLGAEVRIEPLDVADRAGVERLIRSIEREFGGLNGIIHSAGIIRDSLLRNKTDADLAAVLAPKVAGTLHLDRASAHLALDYFVLFSSISALIGNPGQGDYALANAFMDNFAAWRNRQAAGGQRQGRALSINWPLWRNGGMSIEPRREQMMFETTGICPLGDQSGLAFLRRALLAGGAHSQLIVLEGEATKIKRFIAGQWRESGATLFGEEQAAEPTPAEPQPLAAGRVAMVSGELTEPAMRYFKQLVSKTLKRPPEKIASDGSFERYGVDSIILTELTTRLEQDFGSLPNTLLYEYQTVRELSEYFIGHHGETLRSLVLDKPPAPTVPSIHTDKTVNRAEVVASAGKTPIRTKLRRRAAAQSAPAIAGQNRELAIIALAGRYPGAEDLDVLWRVLAGGEDCIREVPQERWDHRAYFSEERGRFDKTYSKWGGFLDGVEDFDPLFFNLSPREAEIINPNERLFLETCWNLLEGAGITRERLTQQYQQNVGVFVGAMYQHYQAFEAELVKESLVSVTSYSAIANRVSYFFDLQGPSVAIDTMCSSSISAIHAAGEALRNGDCRLAIAGGVNLTLHPKKYLGLSVGQVLGSHSGSRSFADGDGYLPAEGVGAVLLKLLVDAEADGDQILAVIKSTAINHGGHTHGFSVPNARAQMALIDKNFRRAGIDPRTVSYVEAAANGSAMGDAIELSALSRVFGQAGAAPQSCAIGAIKSNIGHAEAASGMSQLSKLLLQLQHRQLAPSLLAGPLNPQLDFENSPFVLQRQLADWPRPVVEIDGVSREYPRRATLSAFGAGGSNAHLIIEEYQGAIETPEASAETVEDGTAYIVPLSARSAGALRQGVSRLARHIDGHPELRLNDLAYTLQTGREAMEWRLALVARRRDELLAMLTQIQALLEQGEDFAALESTELPVAFGNIDEVPAAMATLLSGSGAEALCRSFIAANERQKLALCWTQGGKIPWGELAENTPAGHGAKLVPLPTYAFDKKRYWLEQPDSPRVNKAGAVVASQAPAIAVGPEAGNGNDNGESVESGGSVEQHAMRLIAGLLGMAPAELSPGRPLSAYGADSIVMAQLAMQLQAEIDPGLTLRDVQECGSIRDLMALLPAERSASRPSHGEQAARRTLPAGISEIFASSARRFLELQRLNAVDHGRPVFWIHGALGDCGIYQGLAQQISRPFFGIQARGWMTKRYPLQGIQAMAAYYVHLIQSVQPHGPYELGGYSLGGMLAYEVARQLQELGESVISLVMLDTPDVTGERTARLEHNTRLLQAINMSLQMTIRERPERFADVLIHRDEVEPGLQPEAFLQQLTALARQRGLSMSDARLQEVIEQVARIQQAYQVEHYRILPLPRAEEVSCYYFRNTSGLWMGELEPYFSTDSREFAAFNHSNYWQEWQRQLPKFKMIQVASSNHMTLLTEPEVFTVIAEFCGSLYAGNQAEDQVG